MNIKNFINEKKKIISIKIKDKRITVNKKDVILYLVKCENDNEEFIKLGIAKDFKNRFNNSKLPYKITTIHAIMFKSRLEASSWEIVISKFMNEFSIKPNLQFPGWTECYTKESIIIFNEIFKDL
jgi:hypothetical protein